MIELTEKRTECSKTYDLGGRKRRAVFSIAPIHYRNNYSDKSEAWKDIDLTWDGNAINKAPYQLTLEGQKITVKDKKTGEVSTIELLSVFPAGIPFEIIPITEGVSFQHILPSEKIPFEAQFKVTGTAPIRTRAFDDAGELVLETGLKDGILTEKLSEVKDVETGKLRKVIGNIRVDPTTLTVQPSAKDTHLSQSAPTTNYGSGVNYLVISLAPSLNGRVILEFDISGLPAGATLVSATFSLMVEAAAEVTGRTYWVYKLTRTDWVEAQATWNIYKTGSNWTAAGGDYVTSNPSGGSAPFVNTGVWMAWNVLAITQDAYGGSNPFEVLVRDETEDQDITYRRIRYTSKEGTTEASRPKLVIDYEAPPAGVPRQMDYYMRRRNN